jgi:hypothetical protein
VSLASSYRTGLVGFSCSTSHLGLLEVLSSSLLSSGVSVPVFAFAFLRFFLLGSWGRAVGWVEVGVSKRANFSLTGFTFLYLDHGVLWVCFVGENDMGRVALAWAYTWDFLFCMFAFLATELSRF